MQARSVRAITSAIEVHGFRILVVGILASVIWKFAASFVKFGVTAQKRLGILSPTLMPEQVDLGNQANMGIRACFGDLLYLIRRKRPSVGNFRVLLELESVVDFKHQG